jgi:mono/diheme cytochrome c family protein
VILLAVLGCAPDADSADPFCTDAPVVTWENYGEAILVENCQGCHGSAAVNRAGAPESVSFDTHEQALAWRERILAVTAAEGATMPPAVPMDDAARERLHIWLRCWED